MRATDLVLEVAAAAAAAGLPGEQQDGQGALAVVAERQSSVAGVDVDVVRAL